MAVLVGIAAYGMSCFYGFYQDDAFISLRFSRNLAAGHGLVFNPGERVEGFSNPLWTLFGSLTTVLGLDSMAIWAWLGIFAGLASVLLTLRIGCFVMHPLSAAIAAALVASTTTLHAWSGSGMESSFFTLLLLLSIERKASSPDPETWRTRRVQSFLLLGAAQWIRPEAPLFAATLLLLEGIEIFQSGNSEGGPSESPPSSRKEALLALAKDALPYLGLLLLLIALRWGYYGSLVPNTYLVKGSGSLPNHLLGLEVIPRLGTFCGFGVLWLGIALGQLEPGPLPRGSRVARGLRRWSLLIGVFGALVLAQLFLILRVPWSPESAARAAEALPLERWGWIALLAILGAGTALRFESLRYRKPHLLDWVQWIWIGYLYYLVRIGGDLLPLHRLFLPAIPLQALLALESFERLMDGGGVLSWFPYGKEDPIEAAEVRGGVAALVLPTCLVLVATSLRYTAEQSHFRTVRLALDACHGQAGRDIQAIVAANPGFRPTVIAQDMGVLPIEAPGANFLDTIGLCDRQVAEVLFRYRYSPYFRYLIWNDKGWRGRIVEMEGVLREQISSRKPDYAVININTEIGDLSQVRDALARRDAEYFRPLIEKNTFFYGWTGTLDFRRNYVFAKGYEYSTNHFLLTYRRLENPWLESEAEAPQP